MSENRRPDGKPNKQKFKVHYQKISGQHSMAKNNIKALEKVRMQYQCECSHRDQNGQFAIRPPKQGAPKSKYTGNTLYTCNSCEKKIDIANISEEEYEKAKDTINRVLDIAKMHLNLGIENDVTLLENIARIQFRLNTTVDQVYGAIRKNGGKKSNKNNNNRGPVIENVRPRY